VTNLFQICIIFFDAQITLSLFPRNSYEMYVGGHFGFTWPVTKINIFGFIAPNIINSTLAINGKQVDVREHDSCKIRCSEVIGYKECNVKNHTLNQ